MYKHVQAQSELIHEKKNRFARQLDKRQLLVFYLFLLMQFIFNVVSGCAGNSRLQNSTLGFSESFKEREETVALRTEGQINLHANYKLELWTFI